MIFHTNANLAQSIQDYCGPNWNIFLFTKEDLTAVEALGSTEDIRFAVSQQTLINNSQAILNATSLNTNGVLVFSQTGGNTGLRVDGNDFLFPNLNYVPAKSVAATGSRAALTTQEQINALDKSTAVSIPTNVVSGGLTFSFVKQEGVDTKHVKYIDIYTDTNISPNISSFGSNGIKDHAVTKVAANRFQIDNEDLLSEISITVAGGTSSFNITRVDFFSDRQADLLEVDLAYAVICPVTFNSSVLQVGSEFPYFVADCGGAESAADFILVDSKALLPNEPVRIIQCQLRPQLVELP